MQVYSQMSTSTTLPRSASGVSGAEFTQRSGLSAGSSVAAPARPEPAITTNNMNRNMVVMGLFLYGLEPSIMHSVIYLSVMLTLGKLNENVPALRSLHLASLDRM